MALYNPPRIRLNTDYRYRDSWLPFLGACIVALIVMAIVLPHSFGILGINPRPSAHTAVVPPISAPAVANR